MAWAPLGMSSCSDRIYPGDDTQLGEDAGEAYSKDQKCADLENDILSISLFWKSLLPILLTYALLFPTGLLDKKNLANSSNLGKIQDFFFRDNFNMSIE